MTPFIIRRKEQAAPSVFHIRPGTSDEKAVLEVFKKNSYQRKRFWVQPGESWLDLGANIGAFSVFAASIGCKVQAYEADQTNAVHVAQNLAANGLCGRVVRAAVMPDSYRAKTVRFHVCHRPMQLRRHSVFETKSPHRAVEVPVVRWSELPFEQFPCVKMNVEGVEIAIVQELAGHHGIRKLVFEWSFDKEPRLAVFRAALETLRRFFPYVDTNRTNLPDAELYTFYPPNAFVYAMR